MKKIKPTNYIGYHVGYVDDEYIASPEHPDWDNVWDNANHLEIDRGEEPMDYKAYVYEHIFNYKKNQMKTIILDYGNKNDMYNLERDLHIKYNVDVDDKYFNLQKSGGAYKTIQVDDLEDIKKRILNREFTKDTKENIEDLHNELIPQRLQNRTSEDEKNVRDIRDSIRDEESTKFCEPVRVRLDKNSKRKMFDGNTTLMGAYLARDKVKGGSIEVDEIPYDIAKLFTDDEFNELGVLLNRKPKVTKRPCSKDDVAARIWRRFTENTTPVKDPNNKKFIESAGHRPTDIYAICNSWFNKGGQVGTYVNYQLEHNKKKLQKVVNKYTTADTKVFSFSSSKVRDEDINKWFCENNNYGKRKPIKTKLLIVIYHPNSVWEGAWDKKSLQKKKELKYLARLVGVTFLCFKEMDTF